MAEASARRGGAAGGRRPPWRAIAAAAALVAYALAFQGSRGLWEPDEGRYTDIATQMLRSGDFVVPAFNHEVPHFAKPPLAYWAIAAGIAVAGWNEWGARLANALAFALTVLAVYLLGRRVVPARPWLPALVYATFLLPYIAANVVTTDTLLTLWEAGAMLGFVAWWERRDGPGWRAPLLVMWLSFALASLTKGPVGLLPLLAAATFAACAGGRPALGRMFCAGGVAAFLLVGLGWYAFVAATNPGLLAYFVRDEVASRVASGAFRRNSEWYGALTVYLPVLLLGALPWSVWWIPAVRRAGGTLLRTAWWRAAAAAGTWPALLALWVALPLAVFCVARSRLPLYPLPLFVPLALATALGVPARLPRRALATALTVWVLLLIGLRVAGARYHSAADGRPLAEAIGATITPTPDEVAFVDLRPVWSLSLYLGCPVERIVTDGGALAPTVEGASLETLRTELMEREARTLLVVAPRDTGRVARALARLGRPYVQLGVLGGNVLVTPFGDLRRAIATGR